MNDRDRLLAEALHTDWERTGAAAASRAARSVRRRRLARRSGVAAVAGLVVGLALWRMTAMNQTPAVASAPPTSPLEIISDDELLELLRDEPVLAIRDAHGVREVVWLEHSAGNPPPN